MYYMFCGAKSFNQPIGVWNTSQVLNMSFMFYQATSFNQPIGSWDTSRITDMASIHNNDSRFFTLWNVWPVCVKKQPKWHKHRKSVGAPGNKKWRKSNVKN